MKRGMLETLSFAVEVERCPCGAKLTVDARIGCPSCGISWPTDAPELSCTCPPNADTGAEPRCAP